MITSAIPPEHVPRVWAKCAPHLEKATGTVRLRADVLDLYENCLNGVQTLWIVFDPDNDNEIVTAFTTQILTYPQYNALAVQFLGGSKMKDWLDDALGVLGNFARDSNCKTIEGYGRRAWLRWLEPRGFEQAYITFEKEVPDD